jgi:hypothetical protein
MLDWIFGKGGKGAKESSKEQHIADNGSRKRRRVADDDNYDDHDEVSVRGFDDEAKDYEAEIAALLEDLRQRDEEIAELRAEIRRLGGRESAMAPSTNVVESTDTPETPRSGRYGAIAKMMEEKPLERLADDFDRKRKDESQDIAAAPALEQDKNLSPVSLQGAGPAVLDEPGTSPAGKAEAAPVSAESGPKAGAINIADDSDSPSWEEEEPPVLSSLRQ